MPLPLPALNPDAQVSTFTVGRAGSTILVIDDVFSNAAEIEAHGRHEAVYAQPATLYPGLNTPLPPTFMTALAQALQPHLTQAFGLPAEETAAYDGYFGLVTIAPDKLHTMQTIPHVDNFNARRLAALVYLCDGTQGGTGFYRHRSTGVERQTPDTVSTYNYVLQAEMAGGIARAYAADDHPLFEQIGKVDARYNRLAVYNSNLLHSGQVDAARLSSDPAHGRLTLNLFVG